MMSVTKPELNEHFNKPRKRPFYMGFLFFATIIMPVTAFAVEITTRLCADTFFDPMPTLFHVLLVLSVPLINLQTWFDVHNKNTKRLKTLAFANGFVLFVSLAYSIVYAPLLPLAFIALIFALLGLLPMTPFFALVGTLLLRNELKKLSVETKPSAPRLRGLPVSFATVLILFTLAETPMILTRIGLEKAVSAETAERDNGLRFLKKFSNQDLILRECYEQTGRATFGFVGDFIKFGNIDDQSNGNFSAEQVREIFYRLYGESYSSFPTPRGVKNWDRRWIEKLEIDSDGVANRLNEGLSLTSSQIDGSVDGEAALGYVEWTVTFKNERTFQQEAAATIQLPPNAVVSRLTLWINGEEREAAFAGRGRVTEAYNSVTAQRRDPVLVTTAGKDKISMRAFPVQPNGGEMKMRIGISTPLVVTSATESLLPLPRFVTRNFAVSTEHAVWIESKKQLESANQNFVYDNKNGVSSVRGKVSNADLSNIGSPIRALRTNGKNVAFAKFNADSGEIVRQEIIEITNQKPSRLIFVVDANTKMKPYQAEIADAIENLPSEIETFSILTDGNGLNENIAAPKFASGTKAEISAQIKNARLEGGTDAANALETALNLADANPNSAIIWIHAPQLEQLDSFDAVKQHLQRRPTDSKIYDLQTKAGANHVSKELDGYGNLQTVARFADFKTDLQRFLNEIAKNQTSFAVNRTFEKSAADKKSANAVSGDAKETSSHLVRLWANEETMRFLRNGDDKSALELAAKYQLVTPISGAVVLETQEQYERFGLKPVEKGTVPTIPEPHEYLLFAIVLSILAWFGWRYQFAKNANRS